MERNKVIGASAILLILSSLTFLGGVELGDDNLYYCEDRAIVMQCDSIGKYGLENGKCFNSDIGNKICKTGEGWLKVENDFIMEDKDQAKPDGQYSCDSTQCVPI